MSEMINSPPQMKSNEKTAYTVDLRSDTVSKPTEAMRDAMRNAIVGDDVYEEDPTVKLLQLQVAKLLDKEDALFVPSGTMGNLISIMVHCSMRGSEVILGDKSHVFLFEQAGAAQLAGVQLSTVANKSDGTFDLEEFKSKIRINPDVHEPITSLTIVENTHNMCGGKILPIEWLQNFVKVAQEHNIKLHMDGARLFNASVASQIPAKYIVKGFDSVVICLSKSLGAPVGSVLAGSQDFIKKARRIRKVLGGGMRQAGVIAAAGIVALNQMIDRLADDHRRTLQIAKAINDLKSNVFVVDISSCHTNILMIWLDNNVVKGKEFLKRMNMVMEHEEDAIIVKLCSRNESFVRVTLYYEITDKDVEMAIKKFVTVMKEYEKK